MNTRTLTWGLLASLLLANAAWADADKAGGAEQTVAGLEQKWLQSQRTNNIALLEPLLADNVVETTDEGKLLSGKEAVLADAKSEVWSSASYADLKVTVFDHTAIATGTFTGKGKDAAGKPIDARVRFTDTWVKTASGKWLCVATQDSPIKM